jgi:site-specific DNA recombinase
MQTALGYVRVSTDEQAERGLGLEAQRQTIRAYCEAKGYELLAIHQDPGVSGGKPLEKREGGAALLAAARKGKHIVVAAKLDRLFRSVVDAANILADFDKKGVLLVAIAENFDMTSPYGRAMAQMASVFAELERAMIRERTRAALAVKRNRGERTSGFIPFGWDVSPCGRRLVENAKEQKARAWILKMHKQGTSLRGIAKKLNDRGIKPKRSNRWIYSTIIGILKRA